MTNYIFYCICTFIDYVMEYFGTQVTSSQIC